MTTALRLRLRASVLVLALGAQQLAAQSAGERPAERRIPRRVLLPIVMATAAAAAASVYFVPSADEAIGSCASPRCVLPFTIGAGLFVGYLMGREVDQAYAVRYKRGAPVTALSDRVRIEGEPQWLALGASRGAAAGVGGVQLFSTDGAPKATIRRAAGIRGLHGVDLNGNTIAIAATTGLYEFTADSTVGTRVRDGDVTAVATLRGRRAVAVGDRVEIAPTPGSSDSTWKGVSLGAPVRAMGADPGAPVLWVATDSALLGVSLSGDSLVRRSSTRLASGARSVRSDGTRVAVAAGDRGLWLFDVDGTSARLRFAWTGARFAYDAVIARERLYVAGGGDGLYVLDAKAQRGVVLGLARQTGFAVALGVRGDYTYVLDRTEPAVHRIRSDFPLR
jgi:hypothetical protein